MKTAILKIFPVRWTTLALCAVLLTVSPSPALGLGLGVPPSVEMEEDNGAIRTLPWGRPLKEAAEALMEKAWKAIKDSVDSASPPTRRADPPPQQSVSPSQESAPLDARVLHAVHALRAQLSREIPKELREAMENDDEESIDGFIADGLNVNWRGRNGATLLHYAATFDCPDVIVVLIRRGALVNAAMSNGMTPLDYAVLTDNNPVIIVLADHGGLRGIN